MLTLSPCCVGSVCSTPDNVNSDFNDKKELPIQSTLHLDFHDVNENDKGNTSGNSKLMIPSQSRFQVKDHYHVKANKHVDNFKTPDKDKQDADGLQLDFVTSSEKGTSVFRKFTGTSALQHSKCNPQSERKVRGLWNSHCSCLFSKLHNDILIDVIFTYLPIEDLISIQSVCKRWKYCAEQPHLWKELDATSLISPTTQKQHQQQQIKQNEARIKWCLAKHQDHINSFTIKNIQHSLSPDIAAVDIGTCLVNNRSFTSLYLSSYASLKDTHVKYMLQTHQFKNPTKTSTMVQRSRYLKNPDFNNNIIVLRLEQCPLLTNDIFDVIKSHCTHIESISLRGCRNITDEGILAIEEIMELESNSHLLPPSSSSSETISSLFSPTAQHLYSQTQTDENISWTTLFHSESNTSESETKETKTTNRKLTHFDFSNTGITPKGFLHLLKTSHHKSSPQGNNLGCINNVNSNTRQKYRIKSLKMRGSGELWSSEDLLQLGNNLSISCLEKLDITCSNIFVGSYSIDETTGWNQSIQSGFTSHLKELRIAGHLGFGAQSLVDLIHKSPHLQTLDLGGCRGIFKTLQHDNSSLMSLVHALQYPIHKNGLEKLILWRCFPNKRETLSNMNLQEESYKVGHAIVSAICHGPSSSTLDELDFDNCYFLDSKLMIDIRHHCVHLLRKDAIKARGTRYSEE